MMEQGRRRRWAGTGPVDLEQAYHRHRVPLFNYFRRCGLPRAAAEDLTQGVFLVLLERAERFDPSRGTLQVFLFGVARNLRRAWRRKQRTRGEQPEIFDQEPAVRSGDVETPAIVRQAVASLDEERRETLILREFHGLGYDEIAKVQDVAIGTVRSRLARARDELRRRLRGPSSTERK